MAADDRSSRTLSESADFPSDTGDPIQSFGIYVLIQQTPGSAPPTTTEAPFALLGASSYRTFTLSNFHTFAPFAPLHFLDRLEQLVDARDHLCRVVEQAGGNQGVVQNLFSDQGSFFWR